jgi:hypothetical protein
MADSVLLYAQKRQGQAPPEFIDFLKEAMAHVVTMYEDGKFDPERDAELFKRVYGKFVKLKERVAAKKDGAVSPAEGTTPRAQTRPAPTPSPVVPVQAPQKTREKSPLPILQGSMLRPLSIGKLLLAIAEEDIALVKPLSPKKRKIYIKNSQIPLKDLTCWFRRLPGQMKGPLALLKNSKLKKLILPLMIPRGMGLPEIPDEEATMLAVVSKGQWHGVILCRSLAKEAAPLLSLTVAKNGDLVGSARIENNQELQLLNINQLLEREGFLFLPR